MMSLGKIVMKLLILHHGSAGLWSTQFQLNGNWLNWTLLSSIGARDR